MSGADLTSRIRLGEDGSLALNEVQFMGQSIEGPKPEDLADEFAAFANSGGGLVVLGVNAESRAVTGIPRDRLDAVEHLVREVCSDRIHPPLEAEIFREELQTSATDRFDVQGICKSALLVEIPKSLFVHKSHGGYLRRIGSSKRTIEPAALQRLLMMRTRTGLRPFDELPVARTMPGDLDRAAAERFVGGEADFDVAVRRLGLIVTDGGGMARLSVAGVLMCTPSPQQWLRAAYVQAVFYGGNGLDDHYQIDARDIMGPLDVQVGEALHFSVATCLSGLGSDRAAMTWRHTARELSSRHW